ncbi:glucosaminidase domain-containing protein [Bacteroides acidifaciens]|uniref:glucosaminidase domain-containing protein n=1 Tax=Bacteroides acidifaciens TaxID=85831 RepID=UPI0030138AB7
MALILVLPGVAAAQFNTVKKKDIKGYEIISRTTENTMPIENQIVDSISDISSAITAGHKDEREEFAKKRRKQRVRKKHLEFDDTPTDLPELTIQNLLNEIRKSGIRYEKIVLAQAILETGWFTSSVCRNKNNLFGLTNPRTGNYYEFNHWTESVRAYYTKVQYKFKGGNYLLWLKEIGYAEDPRYISSLIKILRQYM